MIETLKASELIKLLMKEKEQFGDLPVFISAGVGGGGELSITKSSVRFAPRIAFRVDRDKIDTETAEGRFFILSDH